MKVAFARKLSDLSTHATQPENLYHLYEKDGRLFSLIHAVSFCGFVDLIVCPTRYVYAQYEASKVQAGQLNMLAAFLGAALRVMGGWLSDLFFAWVNTLTGMLVVAATYLLLCGFEPGSVQVAVLLFLVCSSALVVGNCALFKLVPMRWRARSLVNLVRLWGWCPT
jgi:NNP family nitrate/nitrite transporter-like MFS transporter